MNLVNETYLDNGLTSIADKIREKGNTSSQLSFPTEFQSAIGNLIGNSVHIEPVLFAVNCKDVEDVSMMSREMLAGTVTNKYILNCPVHISVTDFTTYWSAPIYFIDADGSIYVPSSDRYISGGSEIVAHCYIIANSSNPTWCYGATSVDAYYQAMKQLLKI